MSMIEQEVLDSGAKDSFSQLFGFLGLIINAFIMYAIPGDVEQQIKNLNEAAGSSGGGGGHH
jgi:hypothetical protein